MLIKDDDDAVLCDQRALPGNWSSKCINRAVLVGTPICSDSNANNKAKRPQYFTEKKGEHDFFDSASVCEYAIESNATDVQLCLYTARVVLRGECNVLHTSRAFIYTKELEDALQTAIHEAPLPMRLHRQHIYRFLLLPTL